MKTNWLKVVAFGNAASAYLDKHPKQTKFTWALHRNVKKIQKINEQIDEAMETIEINRCVVGDVGDSKEVILRDAGGRLQFTRTLELEVRKERRKLYNKEDIEFEPYFAREVPADLTYAERDAFAGFVIPEVAEPTDEPGDAGKAPEESAAIQ